MPPSLPQRKAPTTTAPAVPGRVQFGNIDKPEGHRIVIYGPGGIGKTELCCLAPGPVAFFDLESSLTKLKSQLKEHNVPLPVPVEANDFKSVRAALNSSGWEKIKTIVIDSGTRLESLATAEMLATMKTEKGLVAKSIEGYGYGKGYTHLFEIYMGLIADLDPHVKAGRNVIIIAHDCTTSVPNPGGDDWLRYEPRLSSPSSGKASIRLMLKEWADHLLFYSYDVETDADGKGKGSGTRSLYTAELPTFMAKSRTTSERFDIELGVSPWDKIIK